MTIQRFAVEDPEGDEDGNFVSYSDHLADKAAAIAAKDAELAREREVRARLVEALEGAANLRLFVGSYDGKMFDKAKLFAIIDKANAALLAAKELEG